MSYTNAGGLSDDDTLAVIAYIRSAPAAGEPTPEPPGRAQPAGRADARASMLPSGKPIITGNITAPPKGPTFGVRRVHPVVPGLPRMPWPSFDRRRAGQIGPLGPDLTLVKEWNLAEPLPPCAPESIPTARSSANKCHGVRSDEWMMRSSPRSMNI